MTEYLVLGLADGLDPGRVVCPAQLQHYS